MNTILVTDRKIYCAFLLSLAAHMLGLIPIWGAISRAPDSKHATECKLSIGSIQVCEAHPLSNKAVLQPRNDRSDDTDEAKKPTPDQKPKSNKTLQLVSRVDVKSASKSVDSEKSPSPMSQTRAVTSLPSKGDSGRRAATSGRGKENYFSVVRRRIAEAKRYPTEAANEGSEGTAVVGFDLHRNGTVSNIRVLKSSLSGILDLEARKTVQRAAPFPQVPVKIKGEPLNMRIPLSFEIVKR